MEIKEQIAQLLKNEDDTINSLTQSLRTSKARMFGFKASLAILNENSDEAFKRRIEDKIRKENDIISDFECKILEASARRSAFDESLKLLPKTEADGTPKDLRATSELAKVQGHWIRKSGKPLPLSDILIGIGSANDEKKRISLRGSLRNYAKVGRVFTVESGIDTFGLLELRKGNPS